MATRTSRHQGERVPVEPKKFKKEPSYYHLSHTKHLSVSKHICSRAARFQKGFQTKALWRRRRTIRPVHRLRTPRKEREGVFCTGFSPRRFRLFYLRYIRLFSLPIEGDKTAPSKCCGHFSRADRLAETRCGV